MTLFMGLQKIMPTEIKTTVVPYPGYTVTFNNNDKSHQTITAQLEPTWKTTEYTDTNLDNFVAGAENVGVKLHLYVNSSVPGYAHGALSWSPTTFVNGGMLNGPLTVSATNATPIADVVIPTGYDDYYLYNSVNNFYEDTNYDNYKTKSNISGNVILFDLNNWLPATTRSLANLFYQAHSLTAVDLTNLNTSKVNDMNYMFYGYQGSILTKVNVTNFDTSKVTDMQYMFAFCGALTSLDLSNFNTSNVTNMNCMFYGCTSLTTLDLSNFNTAKVTSWSNMFANSSNIQYLIISSLTFQFQLGASITLPSSCKILVPQALISTYQNATNWSTHASKFDAIENYTITRSNGQVTVTPNSTGCCVPYYTEIKYADNTTKQADEVKVGDKLIGYNINSQTFEEIEVLKITEILRNDLLRITTKSNKTLDLSVDHPLLSEDGWASLNPELTNSVYSDVTISEENKLRIGMKLLTEDGYDEIIKLDLLPQNELIKTYTYDVTNGIDTYITNGFISHNHGHA